MTNSNPAKGAFTFWVPLIAIALCVIGVTGVTVAYFRLMSQGGELSVQISNLQKGYEKVYDNEFPHLKIDVNELKIKFGIFDQRMNNIDRSIANIEGGITKINSNIEKLLQNIQNIEGNFQKQPDRLPDSNK